MHKNYWIHQSPSDLEGILHKQLILNYSDPEIPRYPTGSRPHCTLLRKVAENTALLPSRIG